MADYDLKDAVNKVRNKRSNFALYKGDKENQVLITPKPPSSKQVDGLEKECGPVKRLAKGVCFWENDRLVFGTKSTPQPSWETTITKIFKTHDCAKFLPVIVRQLGAGESEEVESEGEGDAVPGVPPTPTPAAEDPAAKWAALKAELIPQIKAALAANPGAKATLAPGLTAALAAEKAGNFGAAIEALEPLRALISAQAPPEAPPTPPPAVPRAEDLVAAMSKLTPHLKEAVASFPARKEEILRPVATFQGQIKAGQLAEARATLAAVAGLLKSLKAGGGAAPSGRPVDKWNAAKEKVDAQINALRAKLLQSADSDLRKIANEGITEGGLNALTGGRLTSLMVALMEPGGGSPTPQQKQKLATAAAALRGFLESDRAVALCEDNPFNGPLKIRDALCPVLAEFEQAAAA